MKKLVCLILALIVFAFIFNEVQERYYSIKADWSCDNQTFEHFVNFADKKYFSLVFLYYLTSKPYFLTASNEAIFAFSISSADTSASKSKCEKSTFSRLLPVRA